MMRHEVSPPQYQQQQQQYQHNPWGRAPNKPHPGDRAPPRGLPPLCGAPPPPLLQQQPDLIDELRMLRAQVNSFSDQIERERAERLEVEARQQSTIDFLHYELQQLKRQQVNRNRQHWPRPQPSPDTLVNNKYMERCDELTTAFHNGTPVALPGAKVTFEEHVGDLCEAPQQVKAHAIGNDAWLSRGVAAEVARKAGRPDYQPHSSTIGHVIKQVTTNMGTVYHLVTKEHSPDKYHKNPNQFIIDVELAFRSLAAEVKKDGLREIAMSYLCSGMDRLHRLWVMEQIHHAFRDVPVHIHFYNKHESRRWKDAAKLFESIPAPTLPPVPSAHQSAPSAPSTAPTPKVTVPPCIPTTPAAPNGLATPASIDSSPATPATVDPNPCVSAEGEPEEDLEGSRSQPSSPGQSPTPRKSKRKKRAKNGNTNSTNF